MLDALELGIVLADAINGGKSVDEREAAIGAWEEERMNAANHWAVIADTNVQTFLAADDPASVFRSLSKFMTNPILRRKA